MLGKLLKYDLKWVYKVVVIFYILAVIFSVIGRLLSTIENSVIYNLLAEIAYSFAISMIASSLINCLMRLWARVIKNVYKDESYLTHTLPVEKKEIYASKVLAAIITIFTTTIVAVVCLFICYYSKENLEALKALLEVAATTYNTTIMKFLLLITVVIFLEIMFIVLTGYVGIILGYKSNKKKMIKTLSFSFIIYMSFQIVTLGLIYLYGLLNPEIMNLINTTQAVEIDTIKSIMYASVGVYSIYLVLLYFIGKKQLERGVNVD